MRITDLYWRRYRIPFRRTFANRYERIAHREGVVLFMETDDGVTGIGEIAPLRGFGGTLAAALNLLARSRFDIVDVKIREEGYWDLGWIVQAEGEEDEFATHQIVLSGLSLAFFDIWAQRENKSLAAFLNKGQPTATRIPVNATLGGKTIAALQWEAQQAVAQGFTCVKMKVGGRDSTADLERVRAVRAVIGDGVTLRVDANGGWRFERAEFMLEHLAELGVALVEQPIERTHRVGLRMLRTKFPMLDIAADESIEDVNSANAVLETAAANVLVIKPMMVGGPQDAVMIGNSAIEQRVGVIITSMLDSGIGIAAALQVAAALPGPLLPCGLATADLLEGTLIQESLTAVNGYVEVPQGIGLGVTLDEGQIQEFCGVRL